MSMHTQLMRGLIALPVAALLLVAALVAPAASAGPESETASTQACALPTRVDFHSMLPGALHIVPVKVAKG